MKDFETVTQRELEDYFKAYYEYGGDGKNVIQAAGASVRAAVKVGWDSTDVDNAIPKDIMRLHLEILRGINKISIPDTKK